MKYETLKEKLKYVEKMTAADTAVRNITDMRKPNDAPSYNGSELLSQSEKTVSHRAKKFSRVAAGFADGKKISRQG